MERRSLLKGLVALVASPAIIKVADLMPVKASLQPYNAYDGISMRAISEYPVISQASVDVLYGSLQVGNIITFAGIERAGELREFRVTESIGSNAFLEDIDRQYREQFGADGAKIGTQLRIRLPNDFMVTEADPKKFWPLRDYERGGSNPLLLDTHVDKVALAAAAVAIAPVVLKTPVTRRFWAKAA